MVIRKRGNKVTIRVPKRRKVRAYGNGKKNALDMINQYGDKLLRKQRENEKALKQLKQALNLNKLPTRIEAYDISNINGVSPVGSMVVFERGEPKKSDYRRFKIQSVNTPDDYKSMGEIIRRRFTRGLKEKKTMKENKIQIKGFSTFPGLVMVDGGKGKLILL